MLPALKSEMQASTSKVVQRTLSRIPTTHLTPEGLRSVGRDLTGWTVLKHIYACVPSYSAAPQRFLLESYRQPLKMHGDTALPEQSSCGMHVTICEHRFSLQSHIHDPVLLALVQFLFLP